MAILTDRASFKGAILIEKTKAYPWASRNSIYLHMKTDYNTDIGKQRITWSYRKKKRWCNNPRTEASKEVVWTTSSLICPASLSVDVCFLCLNLNLQHLLLESSQTH